MTPVMGGCSAQEIGLLAALADVISTPHLITNSDDVPFVNGGYRSEIKKAVMECVYSGFHCSNLEGSDVEQQMRQIRM